jgi:DNA-binding transcriptional MerR regulator
MLEQSSHDELPAIPAKRYFTIGEVSELCQVKPHVLRYWEQEFPALKPVKRRGNRRYYQRHDVLMIREIRHLLYAQGFTIGGARQRLEQLAPPPAKPRLQVVAPQLAAATSVPAAEPIMVSASALREELEAILALLR